MEISRTKDGQVYRPSMGDYEKDQDNSYYQPPSLLVKFVPVNVNCVCNVLSWFVQNLFTRPHRTL